MRRWLLLILFTKLVDAGSLLSLASFLAQTSLGVQNKSAQHFLSIELAFSGENNFYSGKWSKMSKNDEYVAPRKMRGNSTIVIPEGIARSERRQESTSAIFFLGYALSLHVCMHARWNISHVEFYSNLTMAKERGDIFQHSTKRWTTAIWSYPKKESKM